MLPRLPLVLNVLLHGFPVSPLADRGEIETVAPELSSPEFFLERRKLLEEFACSDAFEDSNHCGAAVLGWKGAQQVDVITIGSDLFKGNVVAERNLLRSGNNSERDVVGKQCFAVFDGKDEVVVSFICIVVSFNDGHALQCT